MRDFPLSSVLKINVVCTAVTSKLIFICGTFPSHFTWHAPWSWFIIRANSLSLLVAELVLLIRASALCERPLHSQSFLTNTRVQMVMQKYVEIKCERRKFWTTRSRSCLVFLSLCLLVSNRQILVPFPPDFFLRTGQLIAVIIILAFMTSTVTSMLPLRVMGYSIISFELSILILRRYHRLLVWRWAVWLVNICIRVRVSIF